MIRLTWSCLKIHKYLQCIHTRLDITNAVAEMNAAFDSGSAGMIFHNLGSYGPARTDPGRGQLPDWYG